MLNGQTKRSERRPAGRARHAPAPGAGPQWAPRVLWGPNPKSARHAYERPALKLLRSLLSANIKATAQLWLSDAAARSATATLETAREASASVLWPYTTMDDEGLPLVPPLPLSQPAVQALHDIPDAPPSSESTGGDIDMEESDRGRGVDTVIPCH